MKTPATTIGGRDLAGLGFALLCALVAALVPPFAKLASTRASPVFIATATTAWAASAALTMLAARRELRTLAAPGKRGWLVAIGGLGTAAAFLLLFEGSRRTTAVDATLCLQIEPAYALVIAWVFLGHRPTARRCGGIALLLAGLALGIRPGGDGSSLAGIALLLVTPLCWQMSHVIVLRKLGDVRPVTLTGARYLYGGVLLAVYWLACGAAVDRDPATSAVSLTALLAFQGVVLCWGGTMAWYQALSRLDLARSTAIVVPLVPVLSFAASFVLLGEIATTRQWIGVLLTVAGVLAFATAADARPAGDRIPLPNAPVAGAAAAD